MLIGLVTSLFDADVYEVLKVWSIKRTFEKRGYDVHVVNYQNDTIKVLGKEKSNSNWNLDDRYFRKIFSNYFTASNTKEVYDLVKDAELCIVTDEQLWSLREDNVVVRSLFLRDIPVKRKIAFDASSSLDTKMSYLQKMMAKYFISEFETVYVSDKKLKQYIENQLEKECTIICDSSLLLRKKEFKPLLVEYTSAKDYIVADIKDEHGEAAKVIKKVMEETKLPVYNVHFKGTFHNELGEKYTPGEYLGIVASAKYVVTDHYQGAIFAMQYGRPMVYVEGFEQDERTTDLLKTVKLKANILEDSNSYENVEQFKLFTPHNLHKRLGRVKTDTVRLLDKLTGMEEDHEEYVQAPTGILKRDCCGCYACQEVCPVDAIRMTEDQKGFFYPVVDENKCINCMLCNKSCVINKPRLVEHEETYPKVVAAYNKDLDTRKGSSSGALFPGLAKYIIEEKHGYVAGVCYNENMDVVSEIADNMEDVKKFYGSKYAKSKLDGSYRRIKALLDDGHYVLFSGLPCECSGLRAYLRKDYEKLFICEIMCHAAPSTKVFKKYVSFLENKFKDKVTNVTFRRKTKGWLPHHTSLVIEFANRKPLSVTNRTNNYYRIFANDYIARESCSSCRFTYLNRAGDVTIGDFWGIQDIHPDMFDNQGASFILINNSQGAKIWDAIKDNFVVKDTTLQNAFKKNHSEPIHYRIEREEFFRRMENEHIDELLEEYNDLKK